MKKLVIASLLMFGTVLSGFAQSSPVKVIALMNKASWCPVCQAHGMHFMQKIAPVVMKNPEVKMVINDLSNDQTKASSLEMLQQAGIASFAKKNEVTGRIYFLDAQRKKLLSAVSIAQPDREIMKAYKDALTKG